MRLLCFNAGKSYLFMMEYLVKGYLMIDFGNHCCVAQIRVLSLGTCCPSRDPSLLVSCSLVPHHVIPEGSLEEHGRNFWRVFLLIIRKTLAF